MAKGNYGVNSLGGGGSSGKTSIEANRKGTSLGVKGVSLINESIVTGGFLPDVFEHGANTKSAEKHINSIANIATHDKSSENNIATTFRESQKKKRR